LHPSYSNVLEYENFINKYIYIFLLGGISAVDELQFDTGEWGHLSEQPLKKFTRGLPLRILWVLLEYLANIIPIIPIVSSSLEFTFLRGLTKKKKKNPIITKSADVVPI